LEFGLSETEPLGVLENYLIESKISDQKSSSCRVSGHCQNNPVGMDEIEIEPEVEIEIKRAFLF
jgi:hypothetical protein